VKRCLARFAEESSAALARAERIRLAQKFDSSAKALNFAEAGRILLRP